MKIKYLLSAALCALLVFSCTKDNGSSIPDEWPWEAPEKQDPVEEEPETPTPEQPKQEHEGWNDITSSCGTLPDHIKIYKSDDTLLEVKAIAYIAEVDLKVASFEVWGINAPTLQGCSEPFQTPTQVYEKNGKPSVVINAGFFYKSGNTYYSSSLEVSNSKLLSPNINYASLDWITMYYPTRGAFLEHSDGTYEVCWTFYKDAANHYTYQIPAPNTWESSPCKQPSATYPETGVKFEAKNGIGGGPVLIKNSSIVNTASQELFDGSNGIMVNDRHPRTAIGITGEKKLVLFVCEGRQMTEGVQGFTTMEVAKILTAFGCTDAMNLDGGGSTLMLVNGKEMIKPSDKSQRAVGSCVYIK